MDNYSEFRFKTFLWKNDLHGAVDYLSNFPELNDLYQKYISVFEKNEYYKRTDNRVIDEIDQIYQNYYRNVFWKNMPNQSAKEILYKDLYDYFKIDEYKQDYDVEEKVVEAVNNEGYQCLCGDTQGYLGPYIWKSSNEEEYEVELPNGTENYKLVMMDGFVSRSWLDFISFGKTGAGGWTRKDGVLCCVRNCYDTSSEQFKVSFLKHESQHAQDIRNIPNIKSIDLEYRAKLVELIYWSDDKIIKYLYNEASDANPDNSHTYASYRIIKDLSNKFKDFDFIQNEPDWTAILEDIKKEALSLLKESDEILKKSN